MLLGLNFSDATTTEDKEDLGVALASLVKKRTRVFEARNLDEYLAVLRAYSPTSKDNLILVNTHYNFASDMPLGLWRATDLTFSQKGGAIFGEAPTQESWTYQQPIPLENLEQLIYVAEYNQKRAASIKKELPGYVGRADVDPHTVIFGFTPSWPRLSAAAEALVTGLPEEWWRGVAFLNKKSHIKLPMDEFYAKAAERFYFASYVTVSESADEALTAAGIPHQTAGKVEQRTLAEAERYGRELRRLSRLDSERVVE